MKMEPKKERSYRLLLRPLTPRRRHPPLTVPPPAIHLLHIPQVTLHPLRILLLLRIQKVTVHQYPLIHHIKLLQHHSLRLLSLPSVDITIANMECTVTPTSKPLGDITTPILVADLAFHNQLL